MTRPSKKKEELELAQIFLSAYADISQMQFMEYDDNLPEKIDVVVYEHSSNERLNFQVKRIDFDPLQKSLKNYSDEITFHTNSLKGKEPKMTAYDIPARPWKEVMIEMLKIISQKYDSKVKKNLDLLILVQDGSLPDSSQIPEGLDKFGVRSISCILPGKSFMSLVMYAALNAPIILRENVNQKKCCQKNIPD